MNILLLGSGGREHALAWKMAASPLADRLFCAPGNAGIAREAECVALDIADHGTVIAFCREHRIDLVVVGPEAPLCAGIVDDLEAAGIKAFGPTRAAARLEGSKGFTKDLCRANGIPTAAYERFRAADPAKAYLRARGAPIVVKADGLAAGKGVVVAQTVAEAEAAVDMMFGGGLGEAGGEVVIEEFLTGEEASFFALCDGETAMALTTAQDHKRAFDGDQGPNTGGMGAYSPAPNIDDAMSARVMAEIIAPTLRAMQAIGAPYKGVLYAGLMIGADGPKLIEYNARFGDPETQVLMLRLMSDLVPALLGEPRRAAQIFRPALVSRPGAHRGDGRQGLSGKLRPRLRHRRPRRRRQGRGRGNLPRRHQGRRQPHPRQWRPRAQRLGDRQDGARGAGARLRGDLPHPLAARVLSPRHRLARGGTGKVNGINIVDFPTGPYIL